MPDTLSPDPKRSETARPERTWHPIAPFGLPPPETRAAMLRLVDAIGLHLICPRQGCRRARACADPDPVQLPFCFWQHRGTVRFVIEACRRRLAAEDASGVPGEAGQTGSRACPPPCGEGRVARRATGVGVVQEAPRPSNQAEGPPPPTPPAGRSPDHKGEGSASPLRGAPRPLAADGGPDTLLGWLEAGGVPVASLARSRRDGADEWSWERNEEAKAILDGIMAPGGAPTGWAAAGRVEPEAAPAGEAEAAAGQAGPRVRSFGDLLASGDGA